MERAEGELRAEKLRAIYDEGVATYRTPGYTLAMTETQTPP